MRIASILNEKEITLSCEVFPPKHFDGIAQALSLIHISEPTRRS